jgi:protein-S-isoprenylcysteine O-methyltransferase Ste14
MKEGNDMAKILAVLYGVVAYAAFFVTILYAIGFVGNFVVPKSIDSGEEGPVGLAIVVNVCLMALFAIQHTIMARPAFKEWWTKFVPRPIERSTFVLAASALLALLFWQWRPIGGIVWQVDAPAGRAVLVGASLVGWLLVFYSSFLIDHFDLFGLQQVVLYFREKPYTHPPFKQASVYKLIRHPLMLGFLIAFWFTPTMTYGHLLFSCVITGYIFFGIHMEERDLNKLLGSDYAAYRKETPMILPLKLKRGGGN